MKKLLLSVLIILSLSGCKTTNQDKVQKTKDALTETREALAKNDGEKLEAVATLAAGTEHSLKSVTNPPVQVKTAIDLNARILNITGNPNIDELNKIQKITDLLNSEIQKERQRGEKLLKEKDLEISSLQNDAKEIKNTYESQIRGLESQAMQVAKKADGLQVIVDQVNSWMGLGGVVYGVKRFVTIGVTSILIFLVCFMVLRFFASVNPIAAAIFSIIEYIAAFFINIIKSIAPRSTQFSNHIELPTFTRYKNTLDSVVDTIESLKIIQKKTDVQLTLDDVLLELNKNLNVPEKILIAELTTVNKYGKS